jgi:pyruvate dehydrogenase (quinone)
VLSIPPRVTGAEIKGFGRAAGRIVLNAGIGEMIELAHANARNSSSPAIG